MNPFSNIPDELLYSMCEGWDDKTLVNMSIAYNRVDQLCSRILDQRKIDNLVKLILDSINFSGVINFSKQTEDVIIEVNISNPGYGNFINIIQQMDPSHVGADLSEVPWILPEINYVRVGSDFRNGLIYKDDTIKLRQLTENLIDQGYSLIKR